ncbi:hypothetical protein I308_101270 [Cryptococcus tetragattii IND107]|uniref:Cytochrome c oxidase assembly factor 3 n=1 Tax=Cryptococcus tetragattii IND107 TaxID=1296105 RepID=A0ABR3BZT1_9TREE|nr:mitochondrial protein [Cryptococcus tetragattii IND107]
MSHHPTPKEVDRTYHPKGYGMSPSLKRARKPFILTNVLIGGTIVAFALGVYAYSISAVQQDDFSDVEDLLPPVEERSKIRSIEDEAREQRAFQSLASVLPTSRNLPPATSTPASPSKAIPEVPFPEAGVADSKATSSWGIKRLGDVEWIRKRGWVDDKGNVLVWGAPDVDRIGRVGDAVSSKKLV